MSSDLLAKSQKLSFEHYKETLLNDYKLAYTSRELSLIGRKEVFLGKAQFGVFSDGKELPQIAMAKVFKKGDFRSGYYRDGTFMMAIGQLSNAQFFAQLYTHADVTFEPHSGGRQMNGHFSTRLLDNQGNWLNQMETKNSSADISTTSGSVPRLLGLAMASKMYKNIPELSHLTQFSNNGNEVAFGTIGNGSCSEGHFFEILNAAAIAQVPMILSVWDDGYGISVPNELQIVKNDVSEALEGFKRTEDKPGFEILQVHGWDYPALVETYQKAEHLARTKHIPVLVHVIELTQPLGHSSSGSHERYKSSERLAWEVEKDCLKIFKEWLLNITIKEEPIFTIDELEVIENTVKEKIKQDRKEAWKQFQQPIIDLRDSFLAVVDSLYRQSKNKEKLTELFKKIHRENLYKRDIYQVARQAIRIFGTENLDYLHLTKWVEIHLSNERKNVGSHLYSQSALADNLYHAVDPVYDTEAPLVDGRIILRDNFDKLFANYPELLVLGEDVGKIGGVNQSYEGLQSKYGELRIRDTGIHETAIIGQGIGMALRGLRPIAEIQYLDYVYYALPALTDDLASLQYRTAGGQKAPLIVSTRGHRLVGIWHSGSPMGALINSLRGIHFCVPRNFVQAAGFYNTLLKGDAPALVVEPLNGYRLKEKMPANLGEYTIPLGTIEITKTGTDITVVTYGSTWREVMKAAKELEKFDIHCEVIDIQTLLPFDLAKDIVKSIKKTNRLIVIDEDVPNGGSAYIMQQILENQDAFQYLDSKPHTITAAEHRPPSGFDGDYFAKPQADDIFEKIYEIMRESDPIKYKNIFHS